MRKGASPFPTMKKQNSSKYRKVSRREVSKFVVSQIATLIGASRASRREHNRFVAWHIAKLKKKK